MNIIHDSRPDDSWFEFLKELYEVVDEITAILEIKRPFVGFDPYIGYTTRAAYYPASNSVLINSIYYSTVVNNSLISTLAHEIRHAYQFQKWPTNKTSLTLEEYKNGESNYLNYYLSEIEVDARIFASNYLLYRKHLVDLDTLKNLTVGT